MAVTLVFCGCTPVSEYNEIANEYFRFCPAPKGASLCDYECTVSGEQFPLYKSGEQAFGVIRGTGAVSVKVDMGTEVYTCSVISPEDKSNITSNGSFIEFNAPTEGTYIVTVNDTEKIYFFYDKNEDVAPLEGEVFVGQGLNRLSAINGGKLTLKSNTTYVLQYGAVIDADLLGENLENVTIKGGGVIEGSITLKNCQNIIISDVFVAGNINAEFCSGLSFSPRIISSKDALTLSSCDNVRIENAFIKGETSSVKIRNIPNDSFDTAVSRDITVKDCMIETLEGESMLIGYETVGAKIEDVTFENIEVCDALGGATMAIYNFNNSAISNIRYDNILIHNANPSDEKNYLIDIRNMYSLDYSDKYGSTPVGEVEDVDFVDITLQKGRQDIGINLSGYTEVRSEYDPIIHKVIDISFKNCKIYNFPLSRSYYYLYRDSATESVYFE